MLTKLLVTLVIIVAAWLFLQRRKGKQTPEQRQVLEHQAELRQASFKRLAYGLLAAVALIGSILAWLQWQDQHQLMAVAVVNPANGDRHSYIVYKAKIKDARFETIHGQVIRLSNNERLEISPLEPQ